MGHFPLWDNFAGTFVCVYDVQTGRWERIEWKHWGKEVKTKWHSDKLKNESEQRLWGSIQLDIRTQHTWIDRLHLPFSLLKNKKFHHKRLLLTGELSLFINLFTVSLWFSLAYFSHLLSCIATLSHSPSLIPFFFWDLCFLPNHLCFASSQLSISSSLSYLHYLFIIVCPLSNSSSPSSFLSLYSCVSFSFIFLYLLPTLFLLSQHLSSSFSLIVSFFITPLPLKPWYPLHRGHISAE